MSVTLSKLQNNLGVTNEETRAYVRIGRLNLRLFILRAEKFDHFLVINSDAVNDVLLPDHEHAVVFIKLGASPLPNFAGLCVDHKLVAS